MATLSAWIFLLSLGFPWRWSQADDSTIGFVAGAWPMGMLALYVGVAAYVRRFPKLRPFKSQFVMGMAGAASLALFGCVFYLLNSFARSTIHVAGQQREVWKMTPHIGSAVGTVAALIMFGGALLAFVNRHRLPDA